MTTNRPIKQQTHANPQRREVVQIRRMSEDSDRNCRYVSWVFGLLLLTPLFFLNIIRTCQADIIMTKHRTKIAMTTCQADTATTAHHAKIFATHQQIAMHFKQPSAFLALMASLSQECSQHCTRRVENMMISNQTDINDIATTHPAKIAMAPPSRLCT